MTRGTAVSEPEYHAPTSIAAACRRLEAADAPKVIAGGQTLMLLLRQGFVETDAFVDVTGVPSMTGIAVDEDAVTIGATTTYAELASHAVSNRVRVFADACDVIADPQIRTLGTVGGALCHADPAFDLPATLLSLDAEVRLVDANGARTVPLSAFFVGHMRTALNDGELLESVRFTLPGRGHGTAYVKHAAVEGGWTTVGVAASVRVRNDAFTDARVALSAVGDAATRAQSVETALTGGTVDPETVASASETVVDDVDPIGDSSGSAGYKLELAKTLTERAVTRAVARAGGEE